MEKLQAELIKVSKKLEKTGKGFEKTKKPLEDNEIREILTTLRDSISTLLEVSIENIEQKSVISSLTSKVRSLEDYTEHHHQRSLRGKFYVTFPKDSPPPSPKVLLENGSNVSIFTCDIVKSKYQVKLDPSNFKTCHFTKKGIIFRLWNLAPGSPYAALVQSIKNGTGKDDHSIYVNFSLTPQRSSLLFDLRRYKKEKKLERFYTDADGTLSYVHNEGNIKKRCTSFYVKSGKVFTLKTCTNEELRKIFHPVEEEAVADADAEAEAEAEVDVDDEDNSSNLSAFGGRSTRANSNNSQSQRN